MININKIAKESRKYYEDEDWEFHILKVLYYSRLLQKFYRADKDIIEASVYLHDVARSKKDSDIHHIEGEKIARLILDKNNISKEKIEAIAHCVIAHRGKQDVKPRTIEARIVANADALSHFDMVPLFFYWRAKKGSFSDAVKWVDEKLKRAWSKKLTLPQSKKIIKSKYLIIKELLNNFK